MDETEKVLRANVAAARQALNEAQRALNAHLASKCPVQPGDIVERKRGNEWHDFIVDRVFHAWGSVYDLVGRPRLKGGEWGKTVKVNSYSWRMKSPEAGGDA